MKAEYFYDGRVITSYIYGWEGGSDKAKAKYVPKTTEYTYDNYGNITLQKIYGDFLFHCKMQFYRLFDLREEIVIECSDVFCQS
jgi:hypothetical protein